MTNTELKEKGLTNEEVKYLKWWLKMGIGVDVEQYLRSKTLGDREIRHIKKGKSEGFVLSFFNVLIIVGIQSLFFGLGEFDPFKMKITFVIGIVGSIYYLNEYIQHRKAIKFIEKNVKTEYQR